MPRRSRRDQNYNFFHIMVQGIAKRKIFLDDIDKFLYIDLIYRNSMRAKIDIISYCVMNNHVHLVIYTPKIENMTAFFRYTNTAFARKYNMKNNRVGYVFRDRYKSKPIRSLKQLVQTINYVHDNPIKAKICEKAQNYEFSSYNEYLYKEEIINIKVLKNHFSNKDFNSLFIKY